MATTYILIAVVVVVLAMVLSTWTDRDADAPAPIKGDEQPVWPFAPMPFMTASEVRFFEQLQDAVPECFVFAQVQLSRLIGCTDSAEEKFWLNRINRMSADYVLVADDARTVLAVIELDDWSHEQPDRVRADQKKDKALQSAGLPVLRFDGRRLPSTAQVRQQILKTLPALH